MSSIMLIHIIIAFGLYLYTLNNTNPVTTVSVICKIRFYIIQSTAMMYRWCLTVACFDRFASSSMNLRLRNFAKVQIARRVIIIIIIVWIIFPVHVLIFYNITNNICGIFYNIAVSLYHSIFMTLNASILPISIMTICTLLIRQNLAVKRQRRQLNTFQEKNFGKLHSKRDQQVLVMLCIQMLFYGITIIPLMAIYFYNAMTIYINKSSDRIFLERFIGYCVEMINFLFPVCSFYLYTMASNMFRVELKNMLRSLLKCQWSEYTTRVGPMAFEMQIRTIAESLTIPLLNPQLFMINRNKTKAIQQQQQENTN
jgi:hypothetical protein